MSAAELNPPALPAVSVVFLAFNRRDELRNSLQKTLHELDYPPERLELIVVDNASGDGTPAMVAEEFPQVRLLARAENVGVSGWNDGFAAATGDWVLALDDDCHLRPDGLRRAVAAVLEHDADLASFGVVSSKDLDHRFDLAYRSGLFTYWGCAVLVRRAALAELGGYDPEIFVWGNELEFMLRFFDRGFRHLHLPEIEAIHAKAPDHWYDGIPERPYRMNAHNFAYVAGKFLRPRDAVAVFLARLERNVVDALNEDPIALKALPDTVRGFAHGLRHRQPVRASISRAYRRDFETFARPWALSRTPLEVVRDAVRAPAGRLPRTHAQDEYFRRRARLYPTSAGSLRF